ncbi:glycosyltransferase family 1 protein [Clostridium sp. BSD9I1]|uniref:glycosyltransferase family 4 protein n=1 Tax=Clostridium sp. BSD9I1 TaxID=2003589 RepID=UPI0016464456|nr:glycosyltransferase family 1 protein [Clostridium sp. BSD9I1]
MKIAIDGRGISWYNGTGIGTYTENLVKNMINLDKENEFFIYWWGKNYDEFKRDNSHIILSSKKHKSFFEKYYFGENSRREGIDLFHVPQNGIGLDESISCKKVITIHDLIPYIMPETVGDGYLNKFLSSLPKLVELSDGILTVSEYSKKDILRFFPIDESKVYVTPLAADKKYTPLDKEKCRQALEKTYNITNPFILYIGGFSPRKNVKSLILAFSKVYKDLPKEYSLVITGANKDNLEELFNLSQTQEIYSRIKFTGFIPEDHLPWFYNASDVFVYPSLYEGFGLPPLEAMSCGTPVIASNISSIPEVVRDAGILINPLNRQELEAALLTTLSSESILNELSEKGLKQSKLFSWHNTALATLNAYKKILGS